jgi:hypothetical protein
MPTMKIARTSRGDYRKELGWKAKEGGGYRQHAFVLGRDRAQAAIRVLQLEAVWEAVQQRWRRDRTSERPLWDDGTLAIAMAVAKGVRVAYVSHLRSDGSEVRVPPEVVATWLLVLRRDFPMIDIQLEDQRTQLEGLQGLERAATDHEEAAKFLRGTGSQTLHQALDAFAEAIGRTMLNPDDKRTSTSGLTKINQVRSIKQHAQDMPLTRFDLAAIEALLSKWASRPVGKRGLLSKVYCHNVIKRIREFIRWLHRSAEFTWRKPTDYEVTPIRLKSTAAEKATKLSPSQVKTYTPEQLGVLYEHATPGERVLFLLGINCGFGAGECGTLAVNEVQGDYIRRLRSKSEVYGQWLLWPETKKALAAALARRPASPLPFLLLTGQGKPLTGQTATGRQRGKVTNRWAHLNERVRKTCPGFPRLSFNKLRKTAADLIRQVSDGETAGVFLCHGQPVRTDSLADAYTNRDFAKVFAAIQAVRERLPFLHQNKEQPQART